MRANADSTASRRLDGLDVARFLAWIGMVIVNFDVVMVVLSSEATSHSSSLLAQSLQGRAAATFVVLAGIGFGLGTARVAWNDAAVITLKRAGFLLLVGILNTFIFEADIIHYYAFYFLFGILFIRLPSAVLWVSIGALVVGFVVLTALFDYEAGWNWQTFAYADFWTLRGFLRNLLFNGWHPVVPWIAFLLYGTWLSRLDLRSGSVQAKLLIIGMTVFVVAELGSRSLSQMVAGDPDLIVVVATEMVPPMPLYMIAGAAIASAVIGLCLLSADFLRSMGVLGVLTSAGRQSLTLYIAHILLGMGSLEALGLMGGQTGTAALLAATLFCILATVLANAWAKYFKYGPLEGLMRKFTA